ncbi:hypothetical protein Taro_039445 [Colocasia esculenta]|uniref:Transposase n=1 Tax=Colocasia esculenta TaxID=4460 RepID=A0A843WFT1_COLES|nr:hypothetical protein [Colocasia esculenta]
MPPTTGAQPLPSPLPSPSFVPPDIHFNFAHCNYRCIIKSLAGAQPLPSPPAQPLPPTPIVSSVVDRSDSGPPETDRRQLITLIYSDGRPMKFEPQDMTRIITKALLQYLPGPIAQWKEYPREVLDSLFQTFLASYRFATERAVADARIAWDKIAANRFTDYLNKHKASAKKTTGNFDDPLMWKGHGPPSIRRDYWDTMCDQWATEHFQHRPKIAAENRTKMPEATLHTSGSISFGRQKRKIKKEKGGPVSYKELFEHTHRRKNTGNFVSQKAKEVMETYVDQMVDKHGDDSTQHPEFDPTAWLAATGQPKKGQVFGFGSGLDAGGIINSSQDSHGSNTAVTPSHTLPSDQVREVVFDALNNWLAQTLVPTLRTMGVGLRSPASVASSGDSHVCPSCSAPDHAIKTREANDDEDENLNIHDD